MKIGGNSMESEMQFAGVVSSGKQHLKTTKTVNWTGADPELLLGGGANP